MYAWVWKHQMYIIRTVIPKIVCYTVIDREIGLLYYYHEYVGK